MAMASSRCLCETMPASSVPLTVPQHRIWHRGLFHANLVYRNTRIDGLFQRVSGRGNAGVCKKKLQVFASAEGQTNTTAKFEELTRLLNLDAEVEAVALAHQLKEDGTMKSFGTARQVPKRAYTLEELRLNKIDTSKFLAPTDKSLNQVRTTLQMSYLMGMTIFWALHWIDISQLIQITIVLAALLTSDQVAYGGGFEALIVDSAGRLLDKNYAYRVAVHEAGHLLTAYLLGILPRGYSISSWDAYMKERKLNVQAGTQLCDKAFQNEVKSGQLSSSSLDLYSCVALAGVATEWLRFGQAEGGLEDVRSLDSLLQALRFTQAKADAQVRWAVLNVVSLLRRHVDTQDAVAEAMMAGKSVTEIIKIIETKLHDASDI